MRRLFVYLIIIVFSFVAVPSAYADSSLFLDEHECVHLSILPSSLKKVDSQAFSGTAMEYVVFPEGFLYLGDAVFEKVENLKAIYLPSSTEYISDLAFESNENITIYGVEGSYVDDWAKKHKVPFMPWSTLPIISNNRITYNHSKDNEESEKDLFFNRYNVTRYPFNNNFWLIRDMRPQKRSELHPIEEWFP